VRKQNSWCLWGSTGHQYHGQYRPVECGRVNHSPRQEDLQVDEWRGGLPLSKAMKEIADPNIVKEMAEIESQGYSSGGVLSLDDVMESTIYGKQLFRYRALEEELQANLMNKLQTGECVARGYDVSDSVAAPAVTIPAEKWQFLEPNFEESSASEGGFSVVGIKIFKPDLSVSRSNINESVGVNPYKTGLPGRPTIKHLINPELDRRASAGETRLTLEEEAKALQEWIASEHPDAPIPALQTIKNHIRAKYRIIRKKRPK